MLEDRIREFVVDTMKAKEINSKWALLHDASLKQVIKAEVQKKLWGFDELKSEMRSIKWDSTSTLARGGFDMTGQGEVKPEYYQDPKNVIQAHLIEGIQMAIATDTLGCWPIEGKDIPM